MELLKLIENSRVPVVKVTNTELDKMCNGVHQGVAAEIKDYGAHPRTRHDS